MKIKQLVYGLLFISVAFASCIEKEVTPLGDEGTTIVKLIGGDSPMGILQNPIDFIPQAQQILVADIRKDAPNNAALNSPTTVTVTDDTAAVTAAGYLQLNPAWYTVQSEAPKVGGSGGTWTFTFDDGDFAKPIYITIPDATVLDPSKLYGVGFTITAVSADAKISYRKTVVVEIGAKNPYDGIYSVECGHVQRYTAPGVPEAPGGLNGSLVGNPDVVLFTAGAHTVGIPIPGEIGALFWANGSNSQVAGINGVRITVDPNTFQTTSSAAQNATFGNWAGQPNFYDPATKTFTLSFRWNPASTTREYQICLKYKGPR